VCGAVVGAGGRGQAQRLPVGAEGRAQAGPQAQVGVQGWPEVLACVLRCTVLASQAVQLAALDVLLVVQLLVVRHVHVTTASNQHVP
jgi:hypothetical protein